MSQSTTDLQPTQFIFTVRFVQGYRFLDQCGEAVIRLEDTLDEGWIPGELIPQGGNLRNYTLGMAANFNATTCTVTQMEFLSFEHFHDQTCKIYEVLRSTFDIRRILTPVLRVVYQIGFPDVDAAEGFLRRLALCTPDSELQAALGGSEESLSFTVCARANRDWQGTAIRQRARLEARVILQERQPHFDERLVQRTALLPERHRDAMRSLRGLRRKHAEIREVAVQFDLEQSFETELSSRTFDMPGFLKDARNWTERMESFIISRYR